MRTLSACVFIVASAASAGTLGSGKITTETRQVGAFKSLEVSGGLEVVFRAGAPSVKLEGDDNLLPLVQTKLVGDELVIRPVVGVDLRPTQPIRIQVSAPELTEFAAHGGVDAVIESGIARTFEIDASGGVTLKATSIDAESLMVQASGGVRLELAGKAEQVTWEVSGGVKVRAVGLQASRVKVDASGGCSLHVSARQSIAGEASGGVSVKVAGRPAKANLNVSGAASVDYVDKG